MAQKAPDFQALYSQLGRLLEAPPDLYTPEGRKSAQTLQWLGRAYALLEAGGLTIDALEFRTAQGRLPMMSWDLGVTEVFSILHRAMAIFEMRSPGMTGTFVPVGNAFDAFQAISKILQTATNDVLIVDPYMDESALTEFGIAVPEGVPLRLLADEATYKPTLIPAAKKWRAQYAATRPVEVRLATPKALHDRAIFVDSISAWTLTQSLKDLAKRSPAEIVKAADTAALKIDAYASLWAAASDAL